MELHPENDYSQSPNNRNKEIQFSSQSENQRTLIEASYGKPGSTLPVVERTGNILRESDLAPGAKLDIPSPWGAANESQKKQSVESPDFRRQAGPASSRNNNPGAMYPGESALKFGTTGTHKIGGGHLIAEFPDAISGAAAQFDLLGSRHYSSMRVGDAIAKWCGHNDAGTYKQKLKEAGIDLKTTAQIIMDAIITANPVIIITTGAAVITDGISSLFCCQSPQVVAVPVNISQQGFH